MPNRGTCEFCHEPVNGTQKAAYPVTGWAIERDDGGPNQIAGKTVVPNRIAHAVCLRNYLDHGNQEPLL